MCQDLDLPQDGVSPLQTKSARLSNRPRGKTSERVERSENICQGLAVAQIMVRNQRTHVKYLQI